MAHLSLTFAKQRRIDDALRRMFASFSAQPVPDRLLSIIDQLEDEEAPPAPEETARPRRVKRQGG